MGSKRRIAKHILPIILAGRKEHQWYVEPFVGGGNIIDKVGGSRIGSDVDNLTILGLCAIQNLDIIPKDSKEFGEVEYKAIKEGVDNMLKGYAAYALSYGGKRFGGYPRGGGRDFISESYRNAIKQSSLLQGVTLINSSYEHIEIPKNSIIYCDPPYEHSTGYKMKFNKLDFLEWCVKMADDGHTVFVSEYNIKHDLFVEVWTGTICSSLTKDTGGKKGVEKLYKVNTASSGSK